jgi:hypothetical protein
MSAKKASATKAIRSTTNYRMFHRSKENRVLDLKKHKKLFESMKKYGFLQSFPISCHRNGDKNLCVKDGQHRLTIAESLKIPVYFVEEDIDFDVAEVNSTAKVWVLKDFALKYAANNLSAYQEGLEFCEQYKLPIGSGFALLAGACTFSGNINNAFISGAYKVKDRQYANDVAGVYTQLIGLSPSLKSARMLEACMAICRVDGFDSKRLIQGAARCRERLVSYSTKDAYLAMLEELYNFGRSKLFGLKAAALMAMRERNPATMKRKL